jgi:arylsulfatase
MARGPIFWEHEGNRALRRGTWKLVAKGERGRWELYDMARDRSELTDLSREMPGLAREMTQEWIDIAARTDVFPLDGRTWRERIEEPLVPPR